MSLLGAAIVGAVGSVMGGAINKSGAASANSSNARIAREQMAFQERMVNKAQKYQTSMSNTSYQRAVQDLKKAGLNPMLAYSQGGASTPSSPTAAGASATMVNENEGLGSAIGGIADRYLALKNAQTQNEVLESQIDLNSANAYAARQKGSTADSEIDYNTSSAAKARADTATTTYYQKLITAQTARERSEIQKINKQIEQIDQLVSLGKINEIQAMHIAEGLGIENELKRYQLPGAKNESDFESSAYGQHRRYLRDLGELSKQSAGAFFDLNDAYQNYKGGTTRQTPGSRGRRYGR